ncbi:MAG TPA: hypothetical protein VF698_04605 [Thermoanaerobaculia bacterium]|jgi:Tfp pilus assembly protein PilX
MARRRFRRSERGYVLITAIVLAVLYFGLIQLVLMDSARELAEARRFKARMLASTLAENGAEMAAVQMCVNELGFEGPAVTLAEGQKISGSMHRTGPEFILTGIGEVTGAAKQRTTVELRGRVKDGTKIEIEWSDHSQ